MIWILSDFSRFLCNFFVFVLIFTLFASLWGREGEGVWPIRYLLWSETITEECQRSSLCRPRGEADSSSSLSFSLSWISFLQCNDLVWFGLIWFGLVWFGLVWSGHHPSVQAAPYMESILATRMNAAPAEESSIIRPHSPRPVSLPYTKPRARATSTKAKHATAVCTVSSCLSLCWPGGVRSKRAHARVMWCK